MCHLDPGFCFTPNLGALHLGCNVLPYSLVVLLFGKGYLLVKDNFFYKDLGPVGNLGKGVEAWRGYH